MIVIVIVIGVQAPMPPRRRARVLERRELEQSPWLFDASLLAPVSARTGHASEAANRTILLMLEASLTCESPRVIWFKTTQARTPQSALTIRLALNSFKHF